MSENQKNQLNINAGNAEQERPMQNRPQAPVFPQEQNHGQMPNIPQGQMQNMSQTQNLGQPQNFQQMPTQQQMMQPVQNAPKEKKGKKSKNWQPNPNAVLQTPPAGIYPKTDSQGRVIKYKKRGGVFPFFMGMFSALFVLVFCVGLALSYVFYCLKVDDLSKQLGIDTSFLPVDTQGKTAGEIINALKDGYVDMTVEDAKTKLGFDLDEFITKNTGLKITGLYEIEITVEGINDNQPLQVGKFRVQDVVNNISSFTENLLPEIYKKIGVSDILSLASIDISGLDYTIFKDAIFNTTLNPTFIFGGTTYQIDFNANKVLDKNGNELKPAITIQTSGNSLVFTMKSQTFTVNSDKTKLLSGAQEYTLTYTKTMKKLTDMSLDEIMNFVIPNYLNSDVLTIGFVQEALGLNLIPNKTDADREKYADLLNTKLTEASISEMLDKIPLRNLLELAGIDTIPLDDERYAPLLDASAGSLNLDELEDKITVDAVLDLIKDTRKSLEDSFPFLTQEEFKNVKITEFTDYLLDRKLGEVIKVPERVEEYASFEINQVKYIIIEDKIYTTIGNDTTISTLTGDGVSYKNTTVINGKTLKFANNKVFEFETNSSTGKINFADITSSNSFVLNGITYTISENQVKQGETTIAEVVDGEFFLGDKVCVINNDKTKIYYGTEIAEVVDGAFRINGLEHQVYTENDETKIKYHKFISNIDQNDKFTIDSTIYTFDRANSKILSTSNAVVCSVKDASPVTDILLFNAQNVTIRELKDGNLDSVVESLKSVRLGDIMKNINGFLSKLADVSLGEILEDPEVIMTELKKTTLADFGIDKNNTLFGDLASITLGDIIDDNNILMNTIKNKTLAEITGSTSGIMNILGNLTIDDLTTNPNAITNTLKSSTATIAELLEKEILDYDYFVLENQKFFIQELPTKINIVVKNEFPITTTKTETETTRTFEISGTTYSIVGEEIQAGGTKFSDITNNTFTLPGNDQIYYISGNVVYTYSIITTVSEDKTFVINETTFTLDQDNNKILMGSTEITDIVKKSTISNVVMSMLVSDLFGNNSIETLLKTKLETVELEEVLPENAKNTFFIKTILSKGGQGNPVTIGNFGEIVESLTCGDLFEEAPTSGIITILSYTDGTTTYTGTEIPLSKLGDAIENFDITNITLCELYEKGVLPGLKDTYFDKNSDAYKDLKNENQKKQVENETLASYLLKTINAYKTCIENIT